MVSRSEREYSFDERTCKVQTQTCVRKHCDISWVQSNEDSVLFFLVVGINVLLSNISAYDAYSCLSFITYTEIKFGNTVFGIQGVYKRMVRFQKLTRNLFLNLHGQNVHRQQRQLSKFLMRYQQFAFHA